MTQTDHTTAHRLLAVEDDADCSDLIVRTAVKCGFAAMPAADATEMVAAIRDWRPDVITLDLCLPNIDGLEVICAIKDAGFAGPLIIISGQAEWIRDFTSKAAVECGLNVRTHMSKPVDLRQLRELLTDVRASLRGFSMTEEHKEAPAGSSTGKTHRAA